MGKDSSYIWDPERLRFLLGQAGISGAELGKQCDLSSKSVADYLSGASVPGLQNLIRIADYFCVPVDYLIGRVSYYDAKAIQKDFRCSYMRLRHAAYEKYIRSSHSNQRPIDPNDDILPVWPYNLVDEIFKEPTEDVLNDDQLVGLQNALDTLTDREREVVHLYYKNGLTLRQVGEIESVGPARIRQILAKSLRKLRHPSRANQIRLGAELAKKESFVKTKEAELEARLKVVAEHEESLKAVKDPSMPTKRTISLVDLDLSVRSYNCLARGRINTLSELMDAAEAGELANIRNLGKKSILEICNKIYSLAGVSYHERYGLAVPELVKKEKA